MSKKLAAKASMIQMPPVLPPGSGAGPETIEPRAKTAPGTMAHFMTTQSSAVREADELRDRLKAFEGASPVRALDPRTVRPSPWSNRHADSLADAAFVELRSDIESAGGNVQPVKVRPVRPGGTSGMAEAVLNGSTPDAPAVAYELVFGHRRHRACLDLGLPLLAMIAEVSDRELFESMERENRSRKNLSAWEQGMMYRRALDAGLYPSQRGLAQALGVDVSIVSKSLSLARLPEAIVAAFSSPLEIQFRWAQPLAEVLQRDPDGVLARAAQVRAAGSVLASAKVLAVLLGLDNLPVLNRSTPDQRVIQGSAGRQALMTHDSRGRITIRFAAGVLSPALEAEIAALVETVISRP
jgi:ParB family chromosome partitioning protein